jgi:hypothetical protein
LLLFRKEFFFKSNSVQTNDSNIYKKNVRF